jgi:predicted lipase
MQGAAEINFRRYQLVSLARLADLSYTHPKEIDRYVEKHAQSLPRLTSTIRRHKNAFISTRADRSLYIAVKGTDNPKDLCTNALFYLADFMGPDDIVPKWFAQNHSGAQVHIGYLWKYKHYIHDLEKLVTETSYNSIHLIGHSAGGCVTALMAAHLAIKYPMLRLNHYSFGSPCTGNRDFKDLYDTLPIKTSIRVTNKDDPVPYLPFCDDVWHHTGKQHLHLGDILPSLLPALGDLGDHSMQAHIESLTRLETQGIPYHFE